MATLVYLVRHGETEWNKLGRIQGQQDPPLNQLGRQQAEAVGAYLAELRFGYDCIYCSDLQRARKTAELIAAKWGSEVIPRSDLREQCFGIVEGCLSDEAKAIHGVDFGAYLHDPAGIVVPGGENLDELGERGSRFLDYLREHHSNNSVMVVSHGGFVKTILTLILGMPLHYRNRLEISNAAVSVIRLEKGRDKVLTVNVTNHLAKVF